MSRWPLTLTILLLSLSSPCQGEAEDGEEETDTDQEAEGEPKPQDENHQPSEDEKKTTFKDVMNYVFMAAAWIYAWIPWGILFMCAFDGSIIPLSWLDAIFGSAGKPVSGLDGWQKYIIVPALISAYMSMVLWLHQFPERAGWESFPAFCVLPREYWSLRNIHQAPWLHLSQMQYGYSSFTLWIVAPILLSCGRRTFVFSTFFSSFVGYFAFWCLGNKAACCAGLSPIYCGWLGTLTVACLATCPPNWPRLILTALALGVAMVRFLAVFKWPAEAGGENKYGYIAGYSSGFFFGILHFGVEKCGTKCPKVAFGQFEGYEKEARKQGEPWPGVCAFAYRLVRVTCCCCCAPAKAYADEKAVEMKNLQKW